MDDKCSVCNEEMRSPYVFQEFLGNGKTRLYTGHKRCLGLVKRRLEEGEQLRYED